MNKSFLVFGYGIPKDILSDATYDRYLNIVFNTIYEFSRKNNNLKSTIVFCGGETDMVPPYTRNEADEMIRLFGKFISERTAISGVTKRWTLVSEKHSLSTLENIINGKKIIEKGNADVVNVAIFCEYTRRKRVGIVAKAVFGNNYKINVIPVDFDTSEHRYLPSEFLKKKEELETKHSLWALESTENLKKHHEMFAEKMEFIRKEGPKMNRDAVKVWWEQKLKEYPI